VAASVLGLAADAPAPVATAVGVAATTGGIAATAVGGSANAPAVAATAAEVSQQLTASNLGIPHPAQVILHHDATVA